MIRFLTIMAIAAGAMFAFFMFASNGVLWDSRVIVPLALVSLIVGFSAASMFTREDQGNGTNS